MAQTVTLDAMIAREDFAVTGDDVPSADAVTTLSVENMSPGGMIAALLRKPDFQRETNHWTPSQLLSFLDSFLNNELIPSIILWQSSSFVFVIDGGHRLSALRAWIEDDYGDGVLSSKFFSGEFSDEQKKVANKTRAQVNKVVGSYRVLKDALVDPDKYEADIVKRARTMATRQLNLQWVKGDANKAESSFFKINTLGTPLHKTEELLLRNRRRSIAIAARSVVRAATGHKYWSNFDEARRLEIEKLSKTIHEILFDPETSHPIKTLDLPLGGTKSPIVGLGTLMEVFALCSLDSNGEPQKISGFRIDADGSETINLLTQSIRVLSWISGNNAKSLGLHPAVYFYSDNGRHVPDLLLGLALLFSRKIHNNDKLFFQKFSRNRKSLEVALIAHKGLILQSLQSVMSKKRVERVTAFFSALVQRAEDAEVIDENWIVSTIAAGSSSRILAIYGHGDSVNFSDNAKGAAFLTKALKSAMVCPICEGYLDVRKSVSYDHIKRRSEGGMGDSDNCDLTHPYCNSGLKG
ncbi:GmrSD restriction endonuclease domain-containing protein [Maricaulis sp.]|uniref:GmrSD restriction endonuclease domain-containing protein n=1 Tax=Maricaulis sp. TaxID=1486257 RepID=UPI003A959B94